MAQGGIHGEERLLPRKRGNAPGRSHIPHPCKLCSQWIRGPAKEAVSFADATSEGPFSADRDDFIITGISKELLENQVMPVVADFLRERGLVFSPEKTFITHISDGFDFLGQNLRRYKGGKTLTKPSKRNILTFLRNIQELINQHRQSEQATLIRLLNQAIRGWANYHRHVCSKRTFAYVDYRIFEMVWRWCLRRHPNKSKGWIKKKYFGSMGSRNWVFQTTYVTRAIEKTIRLFQASDVPIKRHRLIKGEANPYDPSWKSYLEGRKTSNQKLPRHEGNDVTRA